MLRKVRKNERTNFQAESSLSNFTGENFSEDGTIWREFDGGCTLRWTNFHGKVSMRGGLFHGG